MLWVYANPDSGCSKFFKSLDVCAMKERLMLNDGIDGAYPLWCKDTECNAYDVASFYVCKHFQNGVWAEYWQTCGE